MIMWLKNHNRTESKITVIFYIAWEQQKENTALKQGEKYFCRNNDFMKGL